MKAPIPDRWFSRLVFSGRPPHSAYVLGFSVRFPGRTPNNARAWLKAHGYEFSGRSWNRADRKPSRMTYAQRSAHTARVQARHRRERA